MLLSSEMKCKWLFFSKSLLVQSVLTLILILPSLALTAQDTTVVVTPDTTVREVPKISTVIAPDKQKTQSVQTPDTTVREAQSARQTPDTAVKEAHSAKKASIYSLILPGLGQAYNHKYWKIPIIYAGFGVLGYYIHDNNKEMQEFTEAYRYKVRKDTTLTGNKYFDKYNADDLLRGREYYRRRLELSVIFTAALYILNVVDATVDAHFFDYDVSEDISLNIRPIYIEQPGRITGSPGISLCLKF